MKTKFVSVVFMAMALFVAGLAFTSCGDDNDEIVQPTAKTAKAQPTVYFAGDMLNLFDITCTINNEVITLTADNTEETTLNGYTLREYSGAVKSYSSFPATCKASISCKLKEGIDLKSAESSAYCLYINMAVNNDRGAWERASISDFSFIYGGGVHWERLSDEQIAEYSNKTYSAEATFETAGKVTVSYN